MDIIKNPGETGEIKNIISCFLEQIIMHPQSDTGILVTLLIIE